MRIGCAAALALSLALALAAEPEDLPPWHRSAPTDEDIELQRAAKRFSRNKESEVWLR